MIPERMPVAAEPVTVAVIDDDEMIREFLKLFLERERNFAVVWSGENGREAIVAARTLRPRLAIIDVTLPRCNGIDIAADLHADQPSTGIIMLTGYPYREYVVRSLRAGARGYVLKGRSTSELALATRAVLSGEVFLSPAVAGDLVENYLDRRFPETNAFTPREREVLQLIVDGATTKDVATKLGVSTKTAENHRYRLMRRAGVHNVAELIQFAIASELLQPKFPTDGRPSPGTR